MVKKIEQELAEAKSLVNEKQALYKERVTEVATLEKSIYDHANNRDHILKDLEKKIKTVKTKMQSSSKDLKVHFLLVFTFKENKIILFVKGFLTCIYPGT